MLKQYTRNLEEEIGKFINAEAVASDAIKDAESKVLDETRSSHMNRVKEVGKQFNCEYFRNL